MVVNIFKLMEQYQQLFHHIMMINVNFLEKSKEKNLFFK
jgi:hypothetical protein